MAASDSSIAMIQKFYVAYYGRAGDPAGLEYWGQVLDIEIANGGDMDEIIANFGNSDEYTNGIGAGTTEEQVTTLYQQMFNRDPDAEGLAFYVDQIDAGTLSLGEAAIAIADGATGSDATSLTNKVTSAQYYSDQITATGATYTSDDIAAAQAILADVTDSSQSVIDSYAVTDTQLESQGGSGGGGETFTLTKSIDSVTGGSGDDTLIAGDDGGNASLNAGDQLKGGGGTDTLKIFNAANALSTANFTTATISAIEEVEATVLTTNTLNVSGNADVTKVTLVNGADGVVTLNLNQTAGLKGAINTAAAATFTFTSAAGGADIASLMLSDADLTTTGATGMSMAAVETVNMSASGTNKLGNTAIAAATTLNITGSGSVSTVITSAVTKTIDGSAATGDLNIGNGAAAAAVESIKTGSGDDIYVTTYANYSALDTVEMAGGTDSLRFDDAATFNSSATAGRMALTTGVEQLGTVGAALTVDGDLVSQTSFYTSGAGSLVLTDVANSSDTTFGAGTTVASTVAMKLGANILDVNLAGSKTAAVDLATNGLTVTGSATINLSSAGTDGIANNTIALTAADNQNIVITGSQNLTLTTTQATGTTGFSIDGSAFTGKLTATGTPDADIVKGGSGADRLDGGLVGDTLTGNAGVDTFVQTGTVANLFVGSLATTSGMDTVTDFVAGTDKIALVNTGTAITGVTVTTVNVATAADVASLLTAIGTSVAVSAGVAQTVGLINVAAGAMTGTYLLANDTVNAAAAIDTLIDITGVTGTVTAADFVFA
ncbi:MAG: DUF4214 domain-containing protein [gamma proteobacterium symbiont of Taylorina sp.]|nr:DUF4214 domain-containing protein [gamma proteobacterium symbiont of Taylorina sp.]